MSFVARPRPFRRVSLEVSLKPFFDNTPETRRAVCRELFLQWLPLCRHAEGVDVMLWTSDGSEILDYRGDLDEPFEWARHLGGANRLSLIEAEARSATPDAPDPQGIGHHGPANDPRNVGLHRRSYLYREDPPGFTYRWLRGLVADLKGVGQEVLGLPVRVGDTFDPGPEFAKSAFKYERHREICLAGAFWGNTFVSCDAVLQGDTTPYAAFPGGIPEGTTLGRFLGRQLRRLNEDLGFDFVWLSNGFGFGRETWGYDGALFDGKAFRAADIARCHDGILRFWKDFLAEVPGLPVRTRGTNMTTGVDLASDGVPLAEIYALCGALLDPPVNSPWAALDGDFGLELAGWMSHIAELPGEGFPFRFYTHDPWWMNSPWLDRYQRRPHDLYLPLSVGRLSADGRVQTPDTLCLLSIDDSHGGMPLQVPADVASHVLRAREDVPDQAGPLLWVYPFREYHEWTFGAVPQLPRVYFGDWFVRGAINQGLPVNTVVSTDHLVRIAATQPARASHAIWLSTVPDPGTPWRRVLLDHAAQGGRVLLYGPIEGSDRELLDRLGLEPAPPAEGDFDLVCDWPVPQAPRRIHHPAAYSAGPLTLAPAGQARARHPAVAVRGGQPYALAAVAEPGPGWRGTLAWLRGGLSTDETRPGKQLPSPPPDGCFPVEALAPWVLADLGVTLTHEIRDGHRPPLHTVSRSRNGWFFNGYNPEGAEEVRFRLPHGAPVFVGGRVSLGSSGETVWPHPPAWWHVECRVFVAQGEPTTVACDELPSIAHDVVRRIVVRGLRGAVVRFFPEGGTADRVRILRNPSFPYLVGEFLEPRRCETPDGLHLEVGPVSGDVLFSW